MWRSVFETYELTGPETALLTEACHVVSSIEAVEASIEKDGYTVPGSRSQTRVHPAVAEVRQQRLTLGRLLAQLDFPDADIDTPAQTRARKAAASRWARKERLRATS